ncbi:NAD(P)/FAD-dependent oxidoreductase [Leptospira perdikensis]|uniref:NADH-quinone oxidoreductase subunit D n=1 Tax=Leptospira perdikensis TaxID=2484948 RepID=A0A4R9JM26_9LEPT|nr:FAD-dependent oxidoreductase [Leptospira perdikensis]TGL45194.1 NADH-quinone oxidoreductase subunit D [Leptospira perdikensis]
MKPKILILGAGYAGIMAANRLDKQVRDAEIILISESSEFKERIRYHETAAVGQKKEIPIKNLLRTRVNFLKTKVTGIYPNEKSIKVEFNNQNLNYDYLVIALGSSDIRQIQTKENSIQSKDAVLEFLKQKEKSIIQNLCIIGGGLTGLELATEWKYFFPQSMVTLIDRNELGASFSKKAKEYFQTYMLENKIKIFDRTQIKKIEGNEIEFENQTKQTYDCIVNCTGFQSSSLLKESGFQTNDKNQIFVDPFLRSIEHPDVFVAGDSAYLENSILRMGCVTALPMGSYIADHLANRINGKNLYPFSFQFVGRCVSLGREDGLIQLTHGDDKPKECIIKGKWGARVKELVNRFTIFSLLMEKHLPFRFYFWPKGNPILGGNKVPSNPMKVGDLFV